MFLLSTVQQTEKACCHGDVEEGCGAGRDAGASEKRSHGRRRSRQRAGSSPQLGLAHPESCSAVPVGLGRSLLRCLSPRATLLRGDQHVELFVDPSATIR